jgi:hypothetical protein
LIACLVPHGKAGEVWDAVSGPLAKALARSGDYSIEDAKALIDDGIWLLWIAALPGCLVAAAVTEVHEYPRKRVVWVHAAGGEGEGVAALWPKVRAYAKGKNCSALRFSGRKGWTRSKFLPPDWRNVADLIEVEV